jgi:pSer/pThr/pTyr-binding forkhead associated (FHA) protein
MASLVLFLEDGTSATHVLDSELPSSVGRHKDNSLFLECGSVSSHHAQITPTETGWYVQDLNSSNGTRVNGAPIEEALLSDGDRIGFGDIQTIFYLDDAIAAATAAAEATPASAIPLPDAPAPVPQAKHIPPPPPARKKLPAERLRDAKKGYPGEETSGCMSALGLVGICVFAVFLGLFLRHQSETGRNFITDAVNSVFGSIPRITIQKGPSDSKE